jgi:hypothetical protein
LTSPRADPLAKSGEVMVKKAHTTRMGDDQDKAARSTPFITTIKDITSLLIYFSLAYVLLGIST